MSYVKKGLILVMSIGKRLSGAKFEQWNIVKGGTCACWSLLLVSKGVIKSAIFIENAIEQNNS